MPTVFTKGKMRFVIRTKEAGHLRAHCHVVLNEKEASIALDDLEILANSGFNKRDLNDIVDQVEARRAILIAEWERFHA